MGNPNQFKESGSGEYVCPSGCSGPESCHRTALIALLGESSERLSGLTGPESAKTLYAVHGNFRPITTEVDVHTALKNALGNTCLLYHLSETGELTN